MAEALEAARQQPVVYVDETGAPTGNADSWNSTGKRGWQWVMVTPVVTVFLQGLSRSAAAATELLGHVFNGIVVSDRFSAYDHLPIEQRQLCWAHLIRDLRAIAERPGASSEFGSELLDLQQQLFGLWHRHRNGTIDRAALQQCCRPIRQAFEATLQRAVGVGCERGERTPWARTVRTRQQLLQRSDALWIFWTPEASSPPTQILRRSNPWIQKRVGPGLQAFAGSALAISPMALIDSWMAGLRHGNRRPSRHRSGGGWRSVS
jgi:transposase